MWRKVVLSSSRAGPGKREMENSVRFCDTDYEIKTYKN